VKFNSCFTRKERIVVYLVFRTSKRSRTQPDKGRLCAERAQSRWSAAKASNTFTPHSERDNPTLVSVAVPDVCTSLVHNHIVDLLKRYQETAELLTHG
jgi:hypothetical protein